MAGSTFGNIFKVTTWGESHGPALGVVIDGCPAGVELSEADFLEAMGRRRPGQTKYATPRAEADEVEILSGVFEGKTTGTPVSLMIRNTSQRSGDYDEVAKYYRPGHADYTYDSKYGFRDYRGGGRASGRETAARVAAGVIAEKILDRLGIHTVGYVKKIGPYECELSGVPTKDMVEKSPLRMPDEKASDAAESFLQKQMEKGDSAGGIIECVVSGMPAGVGDPVFDKLDALLAQALVSIGAVKGVEIGAGFKACEVSGSENNDEFTPSGKATNAAGGILGGISDGDDIVLRAAFKPTPSITHTQRTIDREKNPVEISVPGRHDPIIVPRAVVVVESMVNLVLVERLFTGMTARMDKIEEFYSKR